MTRTKDSWLRNLAFFALGISALWLDGCHSAFVQATVVNMSGKPIQLFEVDYPHASFGSGPLAPNVPFHYRFKIAENGPVQVTWTDAAEREHKDIGPQIHEGDEGTLQVTITSSGAQWQANLHAAK